MYRRLILWIAPALFIATGAWAQQIIPVQGHDDARLINRSRFDAVMVSLRFDADGHSAAVPSAIRLEAGEEIVLDDVVETVFGLTTDIADEIAVDGPDVVEVQWRGNRGTVVAEWVPAISTATTATTRGVAPCAQDLHPRQLSFMSAIRRCSPDRTGSQEWPPSSRKMSSA